MAFLGAWFPRSGATSFPLAKAHPDVRIGQRLFQGQPASAAWLCSAHFWFSGKVPRTWPSQQPMQVAFQSPVACRGCWSAFTSPADCTLPRVACTRCPLRPHPLERSALVSGCHEPVFFPPQKKLLSRSGPDRQTWWQPPNVALAGLEGHPEIGLQSLGVAASMEHAAGWGHGSTRLGRLQTVPSLFGLNCWPRRLAPASGLKDNVQSSARPGSERPWFRSGRGLALCPGAVHCCPAPVACALPGGSCQLALGSLCFFFTSLLLPLAGEGLH